MNTKNEDTGANPENETQNTLAEWVAWSGKQLLENPTEGLDIERTEQIVREAEQTIEHERQQRRGAGY